MNEPKNVYAVWSGAPSQQIALLLTKWMPIFLQGTVDCWLAASDIRRSCGWGPELAKRLDESNLAILCLLPENTNEDWVQSEAGTLTKSIEDGHIFCLCFGVDPAHLPGALGEFQATVFEKSDFLQFLKRLNVTYGLPLSEKEIEEVFNSVWNAFAAEIQGVMETVPSSDLEAVTFSEPEDLELPIDQLRILLWLIEHPIAKPTAPRLARDLNMHPAAAELHLDELLDREYIGSSATMSGGDAKWYIDREGRKYLQFKGLPSKRSGPRRARSAANDSHGAPSRIFS